MKYLYNKTALFRNNYVVLYVLGKPFDKKHLQINNRLLRVLKDQLVWKRWNIPAELWNPPSMRAKNDYMQPHFKPTVANERLSELGHNMKGRNWDEP